MNRIFSASFWVQTFVNVFITMLVIYIIKTVSNKYGIPVVADVANAI